MAREGADGGTEDFTPQRRFVVIGGGVAGVTCAERLSDLCPHDDILIISASRALKVRPPFPMRPPSHWRPVSWFFYPLRGRSPLAD